eukprot:RCo012592
MFGVLSVRKALLLWQRCYVQLDEVKAVLRIAPSPTSRRAELHRLQDVELQRQSSPTRLAVVVVKTGRAVQLRTDTPEQREEWAAWILAVQKGLAPTASTPRRVRFCAVTCSSVDQCHSYPPPQEAPPHGGYTRSALHGGCRSPNTLKWAKYVAPATPKPLTAGALVEGNILTAWPSVVESVFPPPQDDQPFHWIRPKPSITLAHGPQAAREFM